MEKEKHSNETPPKASPENVQLEDQLFLDVFTNERLKTSQCFTDEINRFHQSLSSPETIRLLGNYLLSHHNSNVTIPNNVTMEITENCVSNTTKKQFKNSANLLIFLSTTVVIQNITMICYQTTNDTFWVILLCYY